MTFRRTYAGDTILSYWCNFCNEDTGGWVRHDRMVRFHPSLVPRIRVGHRHHMYSDQAAALRAAAQEYDTRLRRGSSYDYSAMKEPPKNLPPDFTTRVKLRIPHPSMLLSDEEAGSVPRDTNANEPSSSCEEQQSGESPGNANRDLVEKGSDRKQGYGRVNSSEGIHSSEPKYQLGQSNEQEPQKGRGKRHPAPLPFTSPLSRIAPEAHRKRSQRPAKRKRREPIDPQASVSPSVSSVEVSSGDIYPRSPSPHSPPTPSRSPSLAHSRQDSSSRGQSEKGSRPRVSNRLQSSEKVRETEKNWRQRNLQERNPSQKPETGHENSSAVPIAPGRIHPISDRIHDKTNGGHIDNGNTVVGTVAVDSLERIDKEEESNVGDHSASSGDDHSNRESLVSFRNSVCQLPNQDVEHNDDVITNERPGGYRRKRENSNNQGNDKNTRSSKRKRSTLSTLSHRKCVDTRIVEQRRDGYEQQSSGLRSRKINTAGSLNIGKRNGRTRISDRCGQVETLGKAADKNSRAEVFTDTGSKDETHLQAERSTKVRELSADSKRNVGNARFCKEASDTNSMSVEEATVKERVDENIAEDIVNGLESSKDVWKINGEDTGKKNEIILNKCRGRTDKSHKSARTVAAESDYKKEITRLQVELSATRAKLHDLLSRNNEKELSHLRAELSATIGALQELRMQVAGGSCGEGSTEIGDMINCVGNGSSRIELPRVPSPLQFEARDVVGIISLDAQEASEGAGTEGRVTEDENNEKEKKNKVCEDAINDVHRHMIAVNESFDVANNARRELKCRIQKWQTEFRKECDTVVAMEAKAVKAEEELIESVWAIASCFTTVAQLRQFKAGSVLKEIGLACGTNHAVKPVCDHVNALWKRSVMELLGIDENRHDPSREGSSHEGGNLDEFGNRECRGGAEDCVGGGDALTEGLRTSDSSGDKQCVDGSAGKEE